MKDNYIKNQSRFRVGIRRNHIAAEAFDDIIIVPPNGIGDLNHLAPFIHHCESACRGLASVRSEGVLLHQIM